MAKPKDITGLRSGKLVAIERAFKQGEEYKWKCQCDCGNITYVSISNLTSNIIRSCGCLKTKPPINIIHGASSHGHKEKLYNVWNAMKQRCFNPNDVNYSRYGGRGIKVCEEWKTDYLTFKNWCLENGYKEGLDLDRTDNDGNYEPTNCRFITHQQNLLNTHRKLHSVINGEDITLREAADKYNFTYNILYNRYKSGKRGNDLVQK